MEPNFVHAWLHAQFVFYLIFSKMFLWNSININNCFVMQYKQ